LMRGVAREYGARFVGSIPHWVTVTEERNAFDNKIRNFFNTEKISYLDLQSLLPHDDFTLHVDQVHCTAYGLERVSDQWVKKIVDENLLGIN